MTPMLGAGLASSDMTVLFLSLAVLLGTARLLGEIVRKLSFPAILGEILAGVLLGPTLMGRFYPQTFAWLFPAEGAARTALDGFLTIGVTLLLLVAGLEVDLSTALRQGKAALLVSATGIAIPFALGVGIAWLLPSVLGMEAGKDPLTFALFVGIALSITALPVIAKTLIDLGIFKSDLGMLIISAAMVNDLVGWIGFAMVLALLHAGESTGAASGVGLVHTIWITFGFVGLALTVGRWGAHRLLPVIQAHSVWPGGVLTFVLVIALAFAAVTESVGIHSIFGAFIAGIAIGDSSHLRERTRDNILQFVTNIFAPLFFASIGLRVSFIERFAPLTVAIVLLIATVSKTGASYLGARWARLPKRESLTIGFGMMSSGAMGIILGQLARSAGLITDELFVALVVMALVTTLASGMAMQRSIRRQRPPRLLDLLAEGQFVPELAARDPHGAIRELAARAAPAVGLPAALIADAAWQREEIMHTGIGMGLAVPHARLSQIKKSLVVIARSRDGVDFDSPDGNPARFICLLLTPADDQTIQLALLASLSRAFTNPSVRERLLQSRSYTELVAAFKLGEIEGPEEAARPATEV